MKSETQKRKEALARLNASTWEDSKARRLDTRTKSEWEAWREAELTRLTGVR